MNKQQALDRLSALENEAKALRDIIEAPEKPEKQDSLLTKQVPGSDKNYYAIGSTPYGGGFISITHTARTLKDKCLGGNFFRSQEIAEAYAKALNTFLLLRHQPGTETAVDDKQQWVIEVDNGGQSAYVQDWNSITIKNNNLSPSFNSFEYAEDAIEKIGVDNIVHMFKTFRGIYE